MKKRNQRNLIGYAALVSAVCGYVGWDYWGTQKNSQLKSEAARLSHFSMDQISRIIFHKPNEEIEVEKTVDGWKLVLPVKDSANSPSMDEFIEGIATEKSLSLVAEGDGIEFSRYGLDKPLAEIRVVNNQGESESFKIGSVKNFQGNSYVFLPLTKKLFTASSTWFTRAAKTSNEIRDRRWMRKTNASTQGLRIIREKDSLQFQKIDGDWFLSDHPPGKNFWKLDQNKVRELINKLNVTDAIEFIGEGEPSAAELKKWGFQKDLLRIEVLDPDKKITWSGKVGVGEDKITRLWVSPAQFLLKINLSDLQTYREATPDSFRDRKEPFNFEKNQVEKIRVFKGQDVREFEALSDRGRFLLKQILETEVSQFDKPPQSGKNSAPLSLDNRIELLNSEGKILFEMKWTLEQKGAANPQAEGSFRLFSWVKTSQYSDVFSVLQSDINLLKVEADFSQTAVNISGEVSH